MQRLAHFLAIYFCAQITFAQSEKGSIPSLKLIDQAEIPFNKNFKNTIVGGLSGIDYDAKNNIYYLISDDRSAKNEARFYSAKIHFTENGLDSIELIDVKFLLQPNGNRYPSVKQNAYLTPDPESIRYNRVTNELAWSSEGERTINANDTILQDPSIQLMDRDGKFTSAFKIPSNLIMQTSSIGPRQNGTLEGISFNEDQSSLYACLEEPLFKDGPKADVIATKSYVRIFKFDTRSKVNSTQFAYPLEKVAFEANPPTAFKVNGVSEILWYSDNKLITIERSFSTGRLPCTVKVFITDLALADDVSAIYSLTENPPKNLATKQLLKNMDDLGIFIDNIEGVTFGPTLPNGHKTLVFVADNNFQFFEKNQFLVFEILP
jgi:hypothetical protein